MPLFKAPCGRESLLASGSLRPTACASLPKLLLPAGTSANSCLLTRHWAWLLATSRLPPEYSHEWRLGYSSALHGASMNTFMGGVGGKGPSILLVRDKQGSIFGGFASESWLKNGAFYGSFSTFVFRLLPAVGLWPAKGINEHFLWCGHNFAELTNGLGFGGQVDYFGLFIDASFEKGHSRPCATFDNPCLLGHGGQEFEVDAIECWLVEAPAGEVAKPTGSVLDRFKEDRTLLEIGGRKTGHSAGYREAPPELDD
ncbi:hypothetical protein WJX72_010314 [[Myrmecia] bisecta]|uniref:Oxidation resistance protein 1 n=1 Tax=[Myrmecia] bisecta TaxID=41462 RepID=A0AAW1QG87_9CHLO